MSRNIIVFLASVMIVVTLFIGYAALVRDPAGAGPEALSPLDALPTAVTSDAVPVINVGAGDVPGGGGVEMTLYDDRSGRATDRLRVADWQPVPGSKNEIQVTRPELFLLLPSGMNATITAAAGRLTADRVQRKNIRPKFGTLSGEARIVIDRATDPDRAPAAERPQDLITITMPTMNFDLELGQLRTAERVEVVADDFRVAGTGLKLAWNQADNVVDTLLIENGEELTVIGGSGLFDNLTGGAAAPAAARGAGPAAADSPARRTTPLGRRPTTYRCVLTGGVSALHFRGETRIGELSADELRLTFDVGGGATLGVGAGQPTSRPAPAGAPQPAAEIERLVVRWRGPLSLMPERDAAPSRTTRRRIEATGAPVRLTSVDGSAVCGRLQYYEDTGQIWLQPRPGERVEFTTGTATSVIADSVYIDRRKGVVKLLGRVALRSRRGASDPRPFTLQCSDWAELTLAGAAAEARAAAGPAESLSLARLRSGAFFGDVRVDMRNDTLSASELHTTFDPDAAGGGFEQALQSAVAVGAVRLRGDDQALNCGRLVLEFATHVEESPTGVETTLYPRNMIATGAVRITRGDRVWTDPVAQVLRRMVGLGATPARATIRGERVEAEFEPLPRVAAAGGMRPPGPRFGLRNLTLTGRAELRDPQNGVAARGAWIAATFSGESELIRATVSDPEAPNAAVYSRPYTVRGQHIVLDATAESLRVDGPSRLSFQATRSLQGEPRATPQRVRVTARERLHIDGRGNVVEFAGSVVARSGAETLTADMLTLLLEDAAAPAAATRPPTWGVGTEVVRRLVAAGQRESPLASARPGAGAATPTRPRVRKEPLRLIAKNAVISSEARDPLRGDPLMHMRIAAPQLNAEIPQRIIRTLGQTTLYMTNRQWAGDESAERAASGLPSAMITRGPSQTAMQADNSMTYVIGPAGPQRRDTVLFEGGVFFVHRAGREMVDFERLFPEIVRDPNRLAQITSRNTRLQCQRLECEFSSGAAGDPTGAADAGGRTQRLNWLLATGDVHLRDAQGAGIRTVQAARAEFDRARRAVLVSGTESIDARVLYENAQTGELSEPAIGREFLIDLERNTVQAGPAKGEFRRP